MKKRNILIFLLLSSTSFSQVGIGTSSPSETLDVNGTARIVTTPTITNATKALVKDPSTGKISEQAFTSAMAPVTIITTNYTLVSGNNSSIIVVDSATDITITVPSTLLAGFVCQIIQKGSGRVTIVGSGSTINSAFGTKTRNQNSAIGIVMESPTLGYITGDSGF